MSLAVEPLPLLDGWAAFDSWHDAMMQAEAKAAAERAARQRVDLTGLPMFAFRTILADPAWLYENWSEKGEAKSPQSQYDCLPLHVIKGMEVANLAHPDGCVLLLWGTAPMVPEALEVVAAWGFTYSSMAAWAKRSRGGRKWAFGTGHRFRSAMEPIILATMNEPPLRARNVRNLIEAPVRQHSRKPDAVYDMAEAIGAGPYLELFARQTRPGWTAWGNQADKFKVL